MARRLGISASALSQIERGQARPSLHTIVSLARELQLSLDDLLGIEPAGESTRVGDTVVTRAARRARTRLCPGVQCAALAGDPGLGFQLLLTSFESGAEVKAKELRLPSGERRLVAVGLAGTLRIVTKTEDDLLAAGDALELEQRTLRAIRNERAEPASLLLGSLDPVPQSSPGATRSSSSARRRRG
jgi:transcriptional regulator with XRE-family HTH domain